MATAKKIFFSLYTFTLANKNNKNKRNPLYVFVLQHLWALETVFLKDSIFSLATKNPSMQSLLFIN